MNEVLRVVDLVVGYGTQPVVKSASLTVDRGELVAICGRSGAGKSTVLLAIAGLVPMESGDIVLNGQSLAVLDESEMTLARRHIGFIYQDAALFNELSILDNVAWVGRLRGLSKRNAIEEAKRSLGAVGVVELADRRPGEISGGESQRVNIARSMVGDTDLLLVDEPTASLDEQNSIEVCRLLAETARSNGIGALVVSHDPIVLKYADRQLEMSSGLLFERGSR